MNQKLFSGLCSGVAATAVAMAYWFYALVYNPTGALGVTTLGNIKCYVVFLVVLCGIFAVVYFLLSRFKVGSVTFGKGNYVVAAIGVIAVFALLYPFVHTIWEFPGKITFLLALLLALFLGVSLMGKSEGNRSVLFLILFFGVIWGIGVSTVNTFRYAPAGAFYDLHHSSAYIDTIYNVYRHLPFEGGITDQYGHYALFFYLPLKIFGCSTVVIALFLGVVSALTYMLVMGSFCMTVKSNVLRVLVIIIAGVAGINPALEHIYWQCYPHRLFFPAVTVFLITWLTKRGLKRWEHVLGSAVMALAVLWNFESGIICCGAWLVFNILYLFQREQFSLKLVGLSILSVVTDVVIPVLVAFGIVNIYNLAVGGSVEAFLGIREFLGMLVNSNYIHELRTELAWGNEIYVHKMLVFALCFCWGILRNSVFGIKGDEVKANCVVAVSIMGLGLLTYYMNRTLAGSKLVELFFMVCLGFLFSGVAEIAKRKWRLDKMSIYSVIKGICGVYACFMLIGYGMYNITIYSNIQGKCQAQFYEYSYFQNFVREIEKTVPKDTWAKGEGTSAIYMELGWDKQTYEFNEVTTEAIEQQEAIFVESKYYEAIPEDFELISEFPYNDLSFGYYVKQQN